MTLRAALGKDSMVLVLLYLDTAQRPGPIPRNRRSAVVDVVGILAQLVKPTTSAVSHASSKAWRPVIHSLPHASSLSGDARSIPPVSANHLAAVCTSPCSLFALRCKGQRTNTHDMVLHDSDTNCTRQTQPPSHWLNPSSDPSCSLAPLPDPCAVYPQYHRSMAGVRDRCPPPSPPSPAQPPSSSPRRYHLNRHGRSSVPSPTGASSRIQDPTRPARP